jgi:hypothetical protein
MQTITSSEGLRRKIRLLKDEQVLKEQELIKQFNRTLEGFKPVNLVRSTLRNVISSPYFIDNMVGISVGLATGFLSKKIIVGASRSIVRKLFSVLFQAGVTRLVTHGAEVHASTRQPVFKNIFRTKELESKQPCQIKS